jgi:serine/threonine protein kinase
MGTQPLPRIRGLARPPRAIGPYRLIDTLGEGGMGVVYSARHVTSGEAVALKTARVPRDTDVRALRSEIRALRRLRHPGVVGIVADGSADDGSPWFAMELLDGPTLAQRQADLWPGARDARTDTGQPTTLPGRYAASRPVARPPRPVGGQRPLAAGGDLAGTCVLLRRLCTAVAHVHARGLVHRDLKPSNVFLRADGMPVLIDFGLACGPSGGGGCEPHASGEFRVGTVHYMAPEQIRAERVDARADLYALGCLMYEALAGQRPFEAASNDEVAEQQLALEPLPPSRLVLGLPAPIEALVLALLAKRPERRPDDARQLARVLACFEGERAAC